MKKLLLLLLLCPILSFAQDWHGVPVGQHNIYKVSVTGVDSFWNNYVRNIYVEDSTVFSGDVRYNFYQSLRKDENEDMDTANGPTWLGRFAFRETNGDEIYLNKYLDTILLKTKAGLNQSWTLGNDTVNSKIFTATVSSVDTQTIDGFLDSIKTIDIQAFSGSSPIASVYNNLQIVLSKAHGFTEVFDFYGFPNYENANYGSTNSQIEIFPILPYKHTRLDSAQTIVVTNPLAQYQPGNEWITQYSGGNQPGYPWIMSQLTLINTIYDSIISTTPYNLNQLIVERKRETLKRPNPNSGNVYSNIILIDTLNIPPLSTHLLSNDSIENSRAPISNYDFTGHSYSRRLKFIRDYCGSKIVIKDSNYWYSSLTGYTASSSENNPDILDLRNVTISQQNGSNYIHNKWDIKYFKIGSCSEGTFFSLKPNSIQNHYQNNIFKLYPNPSSTEFYLETDKKWNELEVISVTGKVLQRFTSSNGNQFSIESLPSGLYMVKIKTDTGNYLQKILKE